MRNSWLLSAALISACASSGSGAPDDVAPAIAPAAAAASAPQDCMAVTSIEIVHTVSGAPVTTRVQLDQAASADPVQALRAYQRAADHFGTANIVSSKPISEIQCFPASTAPDEPEGLAPAARARKRFAPVANAGGLGLCSDGDQTYSCDVPAPANQYTYNDGTNSCTVTNLGEAVSFGCDDSGLIVSSHGDVVVKINSANIRADILERTQAMRRILGDGNVLTNLHFNVVISPDQQAALVDNAAYNGIAQALAQAAQNHQPLPDIQGLLAALPNQPTNVAFKEQLEKAYKARQDRLEMLTTIKNRGALSPTQTAAFLTEFVGKSQLIDKALVQNTAASLRQAMNIVNDKITQLATADPLSTIYEQLKSGASAVLESQTTSGMFDPEHLVTVTPPDLYKSLTDEDLDKQILASQSLIQFNEAVRNAGERGGDNRKFIEATTGLLGLLVAAMDDDEPDVPWRIFDRVEATKFFVENTSPTGTRFDVHLSPGAKTMFEIDASPTSAAAYDAIVVLNEAAAYNAATGKLTVEYQAVITLNVRQALATSDAIRQLYHTEEAAGWLDVAKGFVKGAVSEYGSMASGILHISTHPVETAEGLYAAMVNYDKTLAVVWAQGAELIHRWPGMTAVEKAEFMGHLAVQLEGELALKGLKSSNPAMLEKAIEDAAKLHLDEANLGLRITEHTGIALAPEAASELARRMEQLGASSMDEMVALADKLDDYLPCQLVAGAGFQAVFSLKPPCTGTEITRMINEFTLEARDIGLTAGADGVVAVAKTGLRPLRPGYWETKAGLIYGPDPDVLLKNRVNHVLYHATDDAARAGLHGVFDAGRRGTLNQIDEAWNKITLTEGSSDVHEILQANGNIRYEVNMGHRIGYVGGTGGAAANNPAANWIVLVLKANHEVVTAFPWTGPP